jgi:hypothetical protein
MLYEGTRYQTIGRGHASTAYQNDDTVLVFEQNGDYEKELYSLAGSSAHIQPVTKLEDDWKIGHRYGSLYRMPYIPSFKNAPREVRKLMKEAEAYRQDSWKLFDRDEKYLMFEHLAVWFENRGYDTLAEDLRRLGSWAVSYGSSMTLELGAQHLGYLDGRVILRDVVFDAASLNNR